MYHYLLCAYQQWCCGKSEQEINDGERFIERIHIMMRYDKNEARKFLIRQPWFISKVDDVLL
jgi:hypothetical protein